MSPLTRRTRRPAGAGRGVAVAALVAASALAAAGCTAGNIAASTPASNGQSFVTGDLGTTVFKSGTGPVAPPVSGSVVGGGNLALAAYRGHVVVLNFWGSWCTPCREEAPDLAALAAHFKAAGVRFLGIDIRDSAPSAEAYMSNFRISYPSLDDPSDNLALDFRNTVPPAGIPTTLVISRSGRITARVIGEATYNGLKTLVQRAAAEPG